MKPESHPLDHPASIPLLRRLLAAKVLGPEMCENLELRIRRDLPWALWLDRGLLALGVALILAGIGYFFAHNWNHLTDNDKLVLSSGAVLLSLAGATWAGLDRFPGKLLLLAACALVGIYIGVFGQIYQTGADDYELFTGWALLIFPWVALSRFMPLWLFWMGLLNMAVGFYLPVSPFFDSSADLIRNETISLVLLNLFALAIREAAGRLNLSWMDRGWSTLALLTAAVVPASIEAANEIIDKWNLFTTHGPLQLPLLILGLYAVFVIGIGFYYSRVRYSLPALAITTLGTCTVLTILSMRVILGDDLDNHAGVWLLMGMVVLAIFGGGVFFLLKQRQAHQHQMI